MIDPTSGGSPSGGPEIKIVQNIADAMESAIGNRRDVQAMLQQVVASEGASKSQVRAARMLASAAIYLAAASVVGCSKSKCEQADLEVEGLRSACKLIED